MPITGSLRETVFPTAYDLFLENLRRKSYLEPEKKLMLAVLENGVECFQKYALARDRKERLLFQEAEYWVQDTNRDWPFSFAKVCETLGFAPDYLRQGLGQWKAAKLKSRAKANIYQLASRNRKRRRGIAVTGRARHRLHRVAS